MKKLKINESKLKLHKEKISKFSNEKYDQVKGGASDGPTACQACPIGRITEGDCDIPTIGHDDGSYCLSATDWGWCWCHGR